MSWENNPSHRLGTVAELEAVVGKPAALIMLKELAALDDGCVEVLARSPIAGFGHLGADGGRRTTFVGGTPGFVQVHSPTRISFPLGEAADGPASLLFLVPGQGETLRVNGVVRDGGFDIEQVYVHCAQAVLRSGLWKPPAETGSAAGIDDFLAASPFLVLSTWDSDGGSDTSPRGDYLQVARMLDKSTLVIPDRKGNKRADTLHNLLRDDRLSFAALLPGSANVLHVRGRGTITVDPAVLEPLSLRGKPPHAALLVDVEDASVTPNDAVARVWHVEAPADGPDLLVLGSRQIAARTGFLGKIVRLVPARWLRAAMNVAYRSGLRKEGYR